MCSIDLQGGIYSINLIEDKGVEFTYSLSDESIVNAIISTGDTIEIPYTSKPEFTDDLTSGKSGILHDYKIKFNLLGYVKENIETLNKIKNSAYNWIVLIEYIDRTTKLYNTKFVHKKSGIKPGSDIAYGIEMGLSVPTKTDFLTCEAVMLSDYYWNNTGVTKDGSGFVSQHADSIQSRVMNQGNISYRPQVIAGSTTFNGISQHFNVVNTDNALNITTNYSFGFWFNTNVSSAGSDMMFTNNQISTSDGDIILYYDNTNSAISQIIGHGSSRSLLTVNGSVSKGVDIYFMFTYNFLTRELIHYVGGINVGSVIAIADPYLSSTDIRVGGNYLGVPTSNAYKGWISDWQVWKELAFTSNFDTNLPPKTII